jgi:DNA-directed RNA polymerase subunit RPC12/RpoP
MQISEVKCKNCTANINTSQARDGAVICERCGSFFMLKTPAVHAPARPVVPEVRQVTPELFDESEKPSVAEVHYRYDNHVKEGAVGFNLWLNKDKYKKRRKTYQIWSIVLMPAFLLSFLFLLAEDTIFFWMIGVPVIAFPALGGSILCLVMAIIDPKSVMKQLNTEHDGKINNRLVAHFIFYGDAMELFTRSGSAPMSKDVYDYDFLSKVYENDAYFFIRDTSDNFYTVPKRYFKKGSAAELSGVLQSAMSDGRYARIV